MIKSDKNLAFTKILILSGINMISGDNIMKNYAITQDILYINFIPSINNTYNTKQY